MSSIQFGGLASGLDTQAIISALLAVESRPIALLEQRRSTIERQRNLINNFDGLLDDLATAAEDVEDSNSFLAFKTATDDDDAFFSSSAGNNAIAGTYEIGVKSLATNEIKGSTGSPDRDTTTNGSGVLTLQVGSGPVQLINVASTTLDGIAAAINENGEGVSAQVVDTGADTNPFQLIITSEESGSEGTITLGSDSATDTFTSFVAGLDGNTIREGSDAELTFNGIDITRSSNSISDLIQGVTLDLTAASELDVNGDPVSTTTLTVSTDGEATGEKLQAFVDAYNAVFDFVQGQFTAPAEGADAPPLFGDSTLRGVRNSLRSITGGSVDTGNDAFSLLSQVGIEAGTDGKLTFNSAEFEEAIAEDEDAVLALFTGEDEEGSPSGIAGRLVATVELYTDSVDGLIKARTDGFARLIRDTDNQIERQNDRLERTEQQLNTRFANLEVLLNRLQGQGGALGSIPQPPA
jgi:flagellar hook-associated protein 2